MRTVMPDPTSSPEARAALTAVLAIAAVLGSGCAPSAETTGQKAGQRAETKSMAPPATKTAEARPAPARVAAPPKEDGPKPEPRREPPTATPKTDAPADDVAFAFSWEAARERGIQMLPLSGPFEAIDDACRAHEPIDGGEREELPCKQLRFAKRTPDPVTDARVIVIGTPGDTWAHLLLQTSKGWWEAGGVVFVPSSMHGEQSAKMDRPKLRSNADDASLLEIRIPWSTKTGGVESPKQPTERNEVLVLCRIRDHQPYCTAAMPKSEPYGSMRFESIVAKGKTLDVRLLAKPEPGMDDYATVRGEHSLALPL